MRPLHQQKEKAVSAAWPLGLPFVGNILDVPSGDIWLKFAQLGDVWGDISSLTVFGQTMIIVNSLKVAEDLLDVRGANFADRPVIPMERKLFHQLFGSNATIKQFVPLLSSEIQKFLKNIVLNPDEVSGEIGRTMGAVALRIAYGYEMQDGPLAEQDPYLKMFETAVSNFAISTAPAAFLVDIVPPLRYWPEWLPGGGFHTTAKIWAKQLHATIDGAYDYVKTQMAMGTAQKSFASTLMEEQRYDDYLIKWAAASIQAGGSDTTAAQLEGLFLAMSIYSDVQMAAQKELDAVVGNERLPDISDRAQLPYVDALCKEVFAMARLPRRRAYHIAPAKISFITEVTVRSLCSSQRTRWLLRIFGKMTHDPERYANPMAFNPTRFIATDTKKAEPDPAGMCFGFGRRICPGKLLADTALFMTCSAILATFNISKARENGVFVEPHLGQTAGTVSHVFPFKCSVQPRSARALELIRSG
ncbi:cytochrome P450 [Mycena vulgaris]|nr:cytochrome P450 [Mycena vulgaris]